MHLDSQLRYVCTSIKKFQRIWIPDDVSFWTNIEKPLTCSITPVYLELFVGGKKLLLPLPFPIFDLVHIMQSMLLFPVLMNRIAFTGKWITGEENSCYLNSSLLGKFWY